ncbi:integrase core domain-containing protein [Ignatzschineria cameli]|uniref:Integrase catalytic domain-containing protein n=1 Tax=Ignatzschineria cameli TaxID=2182793 RepID=A0A2U2ASN7_9GAMM|nr:hypothetical protein DC080_04600 [Ignatzschineria cameli]PWD87748.1 hypothetical protein DC077_00220 [Ignatzschineria cameli]
MLGLHLKSLLQQSHQSPRIAVHESLFLHTVNLPFQVRELSWAWMLSYNKERPHESLGNLSPNEF